MHVDVEQKARRTLLILGLGMAMAGAALLVGVAIAPEPRPATTAMFIGAAAFAGACAGRMRWISYFAFKTKSFDPMLVPHHYAWVLSGTGVVLAFLALPMQAEILPSAGFATYALAFVLAAFSEEVWDVLHERVRAILGRKPRDEPTLPKIDGIDVPLASLGPILVDDEKNGPRPASEVAAALAPLGIEYSHQLLAWQKAQRLSELAGKARVDVAALEQLCAVADHLRPAREHSAAIATAAKAKGLTVKV